NLPESRGPYRLESHRYAAIWPARKRLHRATTPERGLGGQQAVAPAPLRNRESKCSRNTTAWRPNYREPTQSKPPFVNEILDRNSIRQSVALAQFANMRDRFLAVLRFTSGERGLPSRRD